MADFDDVIFVKQMYEGGRIQSPSFKGIAEFLLARSTFSQADKGEIHRVINVGHDALLREEDLYGVIKAFYAREWNDYQSSLEKAAWLEDIRKNG